MLSGKANAPFASAVVLNVCGAKATDILPGTARLAPPAMLAPFDAGAVPGVTVIVRGSPARKPRPENVKVSPGPTVPSDTAAFGGVGL